MTNRFVKLKADDELFGPKNRSDGPYLIDGELGMVCAYFESRITWMALTPKAARSLGEALIRQANEVEAG